MKQNTMTIVINRPIEQVFSFSIDPKNTPRWFGNILEEVANEFPPKIGTIYRSRRVATPNVWGQVVVVDLKPNEMFQLKGEGFNVRYGYKSVGNESTELTYAEWVDEGDLSGLTPLDNLKKLKDSLEE